MLSLRDVKKDYGRDDTIVHALRGVSIDFRKSEFVAILGQSGCGKTTLLNIVGGLDRYTSGDLVIDGRTTKNYGDADWDAYRNGCIGFVFQSYNLIPHQSVIANVELALTLTGISKAERTKRAKEALERVGLVKEINKRPNQLSGGQMQRVAIARAIVNNPSIILADEPTGALDSKTSVQVMDILAELAKERLVIMVTHNNSLAEQYANRIITIVDGNVVDDNKPYVSEEYARYEREQEEIKAQAERDVAAISEVSSGTDNEKRIQKAIKKEQRKRAAEQTKKSAASLKHTSMSFMTALGLSWKNLVSKKGRSILISIAGSIGIIGVALVLALSNGFTLYIDDVQTEMLAAYPITVSQVAANTNLTVPDRVVLEEYPDGTKLVIKGANNVSMVKNNILTKEYEEHVDNINSELILDTIKSYGFSYNVVSKSGKKVDTGAGLLDRYLSGNVSMEDTMMELLGMSTSNFNTLLHNKDYVLSQYDVIYGDYAEGANEIMLVVDKNNGVRGTVLESLGIDYEKPADPTQNVEVDFTDVISQELRLIKNNDWFVYMNDRYVPYSSLVDSAAFPINDYSALYRNSNAVPLKITGVMRIKDSANMSLFSTGFVYTPDLTTSLLQDCLQSDVSKAQRENPETNCLTGTPFVDVEGYTAEQIKRLLVWGIGASDVPSSYNIYPKNFSSKSELTAYLDKFNDGKSDEAAIQYTDASDLISSSMTQLIDIISYVLIGFAAISLVVSTVMIAIITWTSVIERTREIGVLRAVGARKKDIRRVFNAETFLIGLAAGLFGVFVSFVLTFPISALIRVIADMPIGNLMVMSWWHALLLVAISVCLTLIAGLIPASAASKKDPVVSLRSE